MKWQIVFLQMKNKKVIHKIKSLLYKLIFNDVYIKKQQFVLIIKVVQMSQNIDSSVQQNLHKPQSIQQDNFQMSQEQLTHQNDILLTFMSYQRLMKQSNPGSLLYHQSKRIENIKYYQLIQQRKRQKFQQAIKANQQFLNEIINFCEGQQRLKIIKQGPVTFNNFSKVKTTIKQFYRQWSDQGLEVNDYKKIVNKAKLYLKKGDTVLAPGSGLGRLVLQFVEAGFGCQGNQVSYFMLFGSNFILNAAEQERQFKIYPFLSSTDYYSNQEDIFRSILIPDKVASKVVSEESEFSMAGGQFTEVYSKLPQQYHGVATCFFIDTANNIFDYVNTIYSTLKPSGIWINYGPLLFHYRQVYKQVSIEVSWEVLKIFIADKFQFLQETIQRTSYCHDEQSQMGIKYDCISFVCRKK